ncbi:nuclear transport factor 2 family protein [Pseudomonas stutzeri]|uniref:YybH family protein n=1 Tax=Stutzerimonas stutzeri TaxID=316 RepID=UPI00210BFD6B|nr:nuclear transport factor 2 family protein [Stutzerimonas stutzeri]MCQ4312255.1 nuclear transport factor 2 family protein [Stutzerimonas stutzeri]
MNNATENQTSETRIRELTNEWERAIGTKDLDRIMSHYAADVLAFDAVGPLQFKGAEVYRQHWQKCFDFCQGEGYFEISELNIHASGDLAYSHFLSHCGGTNEKGEMQSGWMRGSRCWRRQGSDWKVAHEHFSMPFDMVSGQVDFGIEPEPQTGAVG